MNADEAISLLVEFLGMDSHEFSTQFSCSPVDSRQKEETNSLDQYFLHSPDSQKSKKRKGTTDRERERQHSVNEAFVSWTDLFRGMIFVSVFLINYNIFN